MDPKEQHTEGSSEIRTKYGGTLSRGEKRRSAGAMEVATKTLFKGLNPQMTNRKHHINSDVRVLCSHSAMYPLHRIITLEKNLRRYDALTRSLNLLPFQSSYTSRRNLDAPHAVSLDLEDAGVATLTFEDFTVAASTSEDCKVKIRVDVSGARTQAIFDDVFAKLVDAAQPIPGFRRVKGGKTPDVPKEVLLHILGPAKVNYQSIKKIINSTVAEFVEKERLKVTKDLRVEQSFEELEANFLPGKEFGFDAIIRPQKQETRTNES